MKNIGSYISEALVGRRSRQVDADTTGGLIQDAIEKWLKKEVPVLKAVSWEKGDREDEYRIIVDQGASGFFQRVTIKDTSLLKQIPGDWHVCLVPAPDYARAYVCPAEISIDTPLDAGETERISELFGKWGTYNLYLRAPVRGTLNMNLRNNVFGRAEVVMEPEYIKSARSSVLNLRLADPNDPGRLTLVFPGTPLDKAAGFIKKGFISIDGLKKRSGVPIAISIQDDQLPSVTSAIDDNYNFRADYDKEIWNNSSKNIPDALEEIRKMLDDCLWKGSNSILEDSLHFILLTGPMGDTIYRIDILRDATVFASQGNIYIQSKSKPEIIYNLCRVGA